MLQLVMTLNGKIHFIIKKIFFRNNCKSMKETIFEKISNTHTNSYVETLTML